MRFYLEVTTAYFGRAFSTKPSYINLYSTCHWLWWESSYDRPSSEYVTLYTLFILQIYFSTMQEFIRIYGTCLQQKFYNLWYKCNKMSVWYWSSVWNEHLAQQWMKQYFVCKKIYTEPAAWNIEWFLRFINYLKEAKELFQTPLPPEIVKKFQLPFDYLPLVYKRVAYFPCSLMCWSLWCYSEVAHFRIFLLNSL